jgi:ribose 5-phosphate isomerase B
MRRIRLLGATEISALSVERGRARIGLTGRVACAAMRISVAADEDVGIARVVLDQLRARGHDPLARGALAAGERADWAWAAESAARDVADGRADAAIVCCWTGTGASIAANKVPGVRAALCWDAQTAAGARRWNDANVLALSLRTTSEAVLSEILDAWFASEPSADDQDRANIDHVNAMGH